MVSLIKRYPKNTNNHRTSVATMDAFDELQNLMNAPFERMVNSMVKDIFPASLHVEQVSGYPKIDVVEFSDKLEIRAEVAGRRKEDISIKVENGLLVLKGESKSDSTTEKEGGRYIHRELKSSKFVRTFTLGDELNDENVTAKFEDGLLTITIPKKEPSTISESREIKIQ